MCRGTQRVGVGLLLLAVCAAASAQGVRFRLQQVWSGLNSSSSNPFYVNIENAGANESILISTSDTNASTKIEYPVEVPAGSKKRVMVMAGGYGNEKVEIRVHGDYKELPVGIGGEPTNTRVGLISDNPSDLQFLRGQDSNSNQQSNAIAIGGCVPDDAPDRLSGYLCLDTIVLGEGTERLGDSQVGAIKQYVQQGGVVLFIGGAAQSASSDPRWRDVLPVTATTISTNGGLSQRIGTPKANSVGYVVSKGSARMQAYGMGLASYISVNPFESPIRESEDRRSLVTRALYRVHFRQVRNLLNTQIGSSEESDDPYGSYSSYPSSSTSFAPTASFSSSGRDYKDPFQIQPPSTQSILWVLIAYALIVVPINFLVLRKMNRLELAWFTVPVISVAFSGILLNSTISLYQASATTLTRSVAIVGSDPQSTVYGRSQMFFPRAKSYDLGLKNVEAVLAQRRYSYGGNDQSGINVLDNGSEIIAPQVLTSNLAFKNFSYVQSSNELAGLKFKLKKVEGRATLFIQNQTHGTLTGISAYGPAANTTSTDSIPSGGSLNIDVSKLVTSRRKGDKSDGGLTWQNVAETLPNHLVVYASISEMHTGPKYGEGHPSSQKMIVSAPAYEEAQ